VNLNDYDGKRIRLVRNLRKPNTAGHTAEEVEGLVEVVAPDGTALVIKPRGSTMNMMLEASEIEPDSITVVVEKPVPLASKPMAPVTLTNARRHLLDRHGWTMLIINETTDQDALRIHNELTHNLMGHNHSNGEQA